MSVTIRLMALICLKLLFGMADFCISEDAFDSTKSKPTATLEHLMCFFFFFYGCKRGDLGCVSATQQPMLLKSDVVRVGLESETMADMFMLFHVLAIPSL